MTVDYSGIAENLKGDLKKAIDKNKESLKSCPFCGGEARIEAESIGKEKYLYSVSCINDCVTQGIYHKTVDSAIKAWNTRKPLERVIERLEEEKGIAFLTLANTRDIKYDFAYDNVVAYINKAIAIIKEELM